MWPRLNMINELCSLLWISFSLLDAPKVVCSNITVPSGRENEKITCIIDADPEVSHAVWLWNTTDGRKTLWLGQSNDMIYHNSRKILASNNAIRTTHNTHIMLCFTMSLNGVKYCIERQLNVSDFQLMSWLYVRTITSICVQTPSRNAMFTTAHLERFINNAYHTDELKARYLYFQEDGKWEVALSVSKMGPSMFRRYRLFTNNTIGNSSDDAWMHRGDISTSFDLTANPKQDDKFDTR